MTSELLAEAAIAELQRVYESSRWLLEWRRLGAETASPVHRMRPPPPKWSRSPAGAPLPRPGAPRAGRIASFALRRCT